MIYTYKQAVDIFGSTYALNNALKNKKIFKVDEGMYSFDNKYSELEVFVIKHKDIIFTMKSAFYYLGICDEIPDIYEIATDRDSTKYKDNNLKQYFLNKDILNIGVINVNYHGTSITIYSKERMLIELVRYKNKMPTDLYKEVIRYYRNHINDIDISLLIEYVDSFPKKHLILNIIQNEVM